MNTRDVITCWAEIYIDHLGWVGFDPTYKKCIDENYIRICSGFDALDASTIRAQQQINKKVYQLESKLRSHKD